MNLSVKRLASITQFFALLGCLAAFPQPSLTQSLQGQALVDQEKQWRGCEDGYYTGPRPGRRGFSNDKYLWVVTPEFAKRFCMPEHLIHPDLKGAQAIAFRMVDGADFDRCGVDADGKENCLQDSKARFEIYLSKSLNLPAANPEVRFFEDARTTSDWHITDRERSERGQSYRAGRYKLPPGKTPRFKNPYDHPDPGYRFGLVYAHEGKGRWPAAPLWEVGFRGDWVQGIDMLVLEEQLGMGFQQAQKNAQYNKLSLDVAQPIIVMRKRADMRDTWEMQVPEDFAHVIYLPKPFVEKVRQAALNQGGNWLNFVKTLQQR